jgi:hypothetical protein
MACRENLERGVSADDDLWRDICSQMPPGGVK